MMLFAMPDACRLFYFAMSPMLPRRYEFDDVII